MRRGAGCDVVARARDGDEEAWAALFARYDPRLVQWLRTMPSGDASRTAEDLAAEAWLVAATKIGCFVGDERCFAAWLFRIGYRVSAGRRRTAQRRRTFPLAVESDSEAVWGTIEDRAAEAEAADTTRHLLVHLPVREAQVVACLDVIGLDVATTGRMLGISEGAVRVAHHRGLRRLRARVRPLDVSEPM
ncbi:RNA polymerase sigma factor [Nocardioides sp. KR10-350]|uniref:RNA polymerase sigma factor n=1 Tax=Nocardioides cheoyonin TaxID=3156615 RepID=UPI0032B4D752